MSAKLAAFQVRLPPDMLAWIDAYRSRQPAVPSRAETLRWLISLAIAVEERAQSNEPPDPQARISDDA